MYANDHINLVYKVGRKSYLWRKLLSWSLRQATKGLKHKLQILLVKLTTHVFFQNKRFVKSISQLALLHQGSQSYQCSSAVALCAPSVWKVWWSQAVPGQHHAWHPSLPPAAGSKLLPGPQGLVLHPSSWWYWLWMKEEKGLLKNGFKGGRTKFLCKLRLF